VQANPNVRDANKIYKANRCSCPLAVNRAVFFFAAHALQTKGNVNNLQYSVSTSVFGRPSLRSRLSR
jgi:hypothetical protein